MPWTSSIPLVSRMLFLDEYLRLVSGHERFQLSVLDLGLNHSIFPLSFPLPISSLGQTIYQGLHFHTSIFRIFQWSRIQDRKRCTVC